MTQLSTCIIFCKRVQLRETALTPPVWSHCFFCNNIMTTLVVGSSASLSSHSRSFGGPKCSNGSLGQASSSHSVQSVTMRIESMESRSSHLPPIAPRRISLEASSFHSEGKIRIDSMDNSFNDSVSSFGSDAQLVKQRETAKRSKSSDFLVSAMQCRSRRSVLIQRRATFHSHRSSTFVSSEPGHVRFSSSLL